MKQRWMLLCCLLLCCLQCSVAQETIVVGQVLDHQTGESVANANIYFARTHIGCSSNPEGYFLLRTSEEHPKQLLVSAIGYKRQKFVVMPGQSVGIQVELEPDNALLPEIVAMPGANPAWDLLENAHIRAYRNNVRAHKDITLNMTENSHLSVSHLTSRSLRRGLWKSLESGAVEVGDSTYFIPLYMAQKNIRLSGKQQETDLLSSKGLLSTEQMEALLATMQEVPDFYQNSVVFFGKNFISPLAANGKRYYHYFLIDSTYTSVGKSYHIRFRPKSNGLLAFEGSLQLDSATSALQTIDVSLPSSVNINYVRELSLRQQFNLGDDIPTLVMNEQRALLDYAIVLDTNMHQYPSLLMERSLVLQDSEQTISEQSLSGNAVYSIREQQMRSSLDSLYHTPLIRFARWVAEPFLTNYLNLWYVDLGRMSNIIRFNPVEQVSFGIPFRTSERLCRYATVGGYGIYGLRDKAWKWGAYVQGKLPTQRLHSLKVSVQDDYVRSEMNHFDLFKRDNASAAGYQSFLTAISPAVNKTLRPLNFERKQELSVVVHNEWHDNFETHLGYYGGYRHYGDPLLGYHHTPFFTYHSVVLTGRVSFHQRKHDIYFQRLYLPTQLPILSFGLEGGCYKMTDRYTPYGKVHVSVKQSVGLGVAGRLDYMLEGGAVLGSVPYPFLEIMHGNQTWSFDPYKFTLMSYGEFAADRYLTLHARWNAGGLLFDRIPWVNRLNLRELVSFKLAYGGLHSHHTAVLALPNGMHSLQEPYVEVGVGIGNILRVLNVESLWRLTNRHNTSMPLWGVRFSLALGM